MKFCFLKLLPFLRFFILKSHLFCLLSKINKILVHNFIFSLKHKFHKRKCFYQHFVQGCRGGGWVLTKLLIYAVCTCNNYTFLRRLQSLLDKSPQPNYNILFSSTNVQSFKEWTTGCQTKLVQFTHGQQIYVRESLPPYLMSHPCNNE